jgi:hypothetical protein
MWSMVGQNKPNKTYIRNIVKLRERERDLLELPRLVKKAMENKCWITRRMKHTHLDRWTCTSGKWMIPRHK